MAFISKELTFNNLYRNTCIGVYTVIEELYWLIADTYFQFHKKKLEKQIDKLKSHNDILNFTKKEDTLQALITEHEEVRKKMVQKRSYYLEL